MYSIITQEVQKQRNHREKVQEGLIYLDPSREAELS